VTGRGLRDGARVDGDVASGRAVYVRLSMKSWSRWAPRRMVVSSVAKVRRMQRGPHPPKSSPGTTAMCRSSRSAAAKETAESTWAPAGEVFPKYRETSAKA